MLTLTEIGAVVAATKGAVDIFDKIAGQIRSVLAKRPKEAEGGDDRWNLKIQPDGTNIVVKQPHHVTQTVTADQLSKVLTPADLDLVRTYEASMNKYFARWKTIYAKKDASQDPLVNAITAEQLDEQIVKMKSELLGILAFLERCGIHLDDHYMNILPPRTGQNGLAPNGKMNAPAFARFVQLQVGLHLSGCQSGYGYTVVQLQQIRQGRANLLPAAQDRGHHAGVAPPVHHRDNPQWLFIGCISNQVFAHQEKA